MRNDIKSLCKASSQVNDEYYTKYESIDKFFSKVLSENFGMFKDKSIVLPCDNESSNFVRYFIDKQSIMRWKTLSHITYVGKAYGSKLFGTAPPHGMITTYKHGKFDSKQELSGIGDFRSDEIFNMSKNYDFVITNPPFSLFGDFIKLCVDTQSKFFVVGTCNKISNNYVSDLFIDKRIVSYDFSGEYITSDGAEICVNTPCIWSNLRLSQKKLPKNTYKDLCQDPKVIEYYKDKFDVDISKDGYPYIDDTDILEVSKIAYLPCDYKGKMGVTTRISTFDLSDYNILDRLDGDCKGNKLFWRIVIQKKNCAM